MPSDPPPPFKSSINLKYVKLGYQYLVNHLHTFLLVPVMLAAALELLRLGPDELLAIGRSLLQHNLIPVLCSTFAIIIISVIYLMSRPRPVYLVDYACFKPMYCLRIPFSAFLEHTRLIPYYNEKTIKFQMYILERSGLGEETNLPPATHLIPPKATMEKARAEAELVIFSAVDDLFRNTGLKPKDIDILIVNCSLFSPTPSLSAMIVNKYRLRSNIRSFNLSGMGCSAGLISIDLARDLLQTHANSNALVISTEIITPNYYSGNQRAMLLPNCLFRMGAAAAKRQDVQKEIEKDEAAMKESTKEVERWLKRVEALQPTVETVITDYRNGSYFSNVYSISIRAVDKLREVRQEVEFIKIVKSYTTAALTPPVQPISAMPVVFGREIFDSRLEEALNFLRDDMSGTLGIFGMGGVGKTTLLKHINNTLERNSSLGFNKVVFVTASRGCKIEKIQSQLAEKLGLSGGGSTNISSYLRHKSFVILLDDLWEDLELDEAGIPMPFGTVDNYKRKLILTTREERVCYNMGARQPALIKVECLGTEDARLLFQSKVSVEEVIKSDPLILEIADRVADICHGLPIALNAVGRAMAGTRDINVWENALDELVESKSKFFETREEITGTKHNPLPLLKFSYDRLEDPKKQESFLLCALWPEDDDIDKDELIRCWIGHGLLGEFVDIEKAYRKGHTIIDSLQKACLLESVSMVDDGHFRNQNVRLHDVIRDMALWIARDCGKNEKKWMLLREAAPQDAKSWSEAHKISLINTEASLMNNEVSFNHTEVSSLPSKIHTCPNLVTMIINASFYFTSEKMSFLKHSHALKYLDLSLCLFLQEVPIEICGLNNLEFLNFSDTSVDSLPEELKHLTKLKFLLLRNTQISEISAELLSGLVNLLELDLFSSNTGHNQSLIIDHLNCLNGGLKALGINVSSLSDFQKLSQMSGISIRALCIAGMEVLTSHSLGLTSPDCLGSRHMHSNLKILTITQCDESLEEVVINGNHRLPNLDTLTVSHAIGLKEIVWREVEPREVFRKLRDICIEHCDQLAHVSWIVYLPYLERLEVNQCKNMEQLVVWEQASEIEDSYMLPFLNFRVLKLKELEKFSSICDHAAITFPSLEYLDVYKCPRLEKLPFQSPASCSNLKRICANTNWWETVQLDGSTRTFLQPRFIEEFNVGLWLG